jgi:shikimate kinase/3-dehydroquinate synthase
MNQPAGHHSNSMIFLYGPSGSGKSTTGRLLADNLNQPFYDLDDLVEAQAGVRIEKIFADEGETGFRIRERETLRGILRERSGVVALGGGALLDSDNREQVEARGVVVLLQAPVEVLYKRLRSEVVNRPLLSTDHGSGDPDAGVPVHDLARLEELLSRRASHYASFPLRLDTEGRSPGKAAWDAQIFLGMFRVGGMDQEYDVRVQSEGLDLLGEMLNLRQLTGSTVIVTDENVGSLYAQRLSATLQKSAISTQVIQIPPGEQHKHMATVTDLWNGFLEAGLERSSNVIALGGGVVGDLAGFAAATFLRGVNWVTIPTTLLAMVDASLGGKTGADLPQGKNLVGAFHSPRLVLADPDTLSTLPEVELRSGLAEVVKHGLIDDPVLFDLCAQGWSRIISDWGAVVRRGMAVKIKIIQADPYEKGLREALNLGHTIGHALEKASGYKIRHGEAVAIGMIAEARLSEYIGLAGSGIVETLGTTLMSLNLPTQIPPGLDRENILRAMTFDKKRAGGKIRFSLPVSIGDVQPGVEVDDLEEVLWRVF